MRGFMYSGHQFIQKFLLFFLRNIYLFVFIDTQLYTRIRITFSKIISSIVCDVYECINVDPHQHDIY